MSFTCLHEKLDIEQFFEQDPYLHIYGLGDLDDFFWPYTTWYGSRSGGRLKAVVLVYSGQEIPTLLGLSNDHQTMAELLRSIQHLLPLQFYAHLSPGLEAVFRETHDVGPGEEHCKMALLDGEAVAAVDTSGVIRLGADDLTELQSLYNESYPGNWFDPRMLKTKQYFGIKDGGRLLSAAGIHVFSHRYRVAALGNITTRTEYRNRGYGTQVTAVLCRSLWDVGARIGLNVRADNTAAVSCYKKIGFKLAARYGEFMVRRDCTDREELKNANQAL
jgi:GNAT superfamily N-acetyltransferase